jgi:uncharacterized repeat protein (TIGR02543 family)
MKRYCFFLLLFLPFVAPLKAENLVKVTAYLSPPYSAPDFPHAASTVVESLNKYFDLLGGAYYEGPPLHVVVKGQITTDAMQVNGAGEYGIHVKIFDFRDLHVLPGTSALYSAGSGMNLEKLRDPLNTSGELKHTLNNSRIIKSWHIPQGVTSIGSTILHAQRCTSLVNVYVDNPVAFSATTFDNVKQNVTLYVPEEGIASYTELWTGFKEIKPRRKVIFHMGDNTTDRVSFTYTGNTGEDGEERQFYWYSTVGEPIEPPEMDEGAVWTPTWYADAALTAPYDLSGSVEASPDPENPEPLHLYAKWSQIMYYTVKLHYNNGQADTESRAEAGSIVAPLVPSTITRQGYYFAGWYNNEALEGERFEPGAVPTYDDEGGVLTDDVVYLSSDLELYAKWEERPWIYNPLVVEMNDEGMLPASFESAFATRTEYTELPQGSIYAIARLEIRGTVSAGGGFTSDAAVYPGYSSWYATTLRDKVVALDLREAHIPPPSHSYFYEGVWANTSSILQEIRLPVDGTFTHLGSPFGHIAPSVQAIYLPASLTRIDGPTPNQCESPFAFTYNLKNMYLDAATPPAITTFVWHQAGNFTLHVPEGSKSAYEADLWDDGTCKWTYRSPDDGGGSVNITLAERPKVTFHTNGGSRPLYTYTPAEPDGTFYLYVNPDSAACETAPVTRRAYHDFEGWHTDEGCTVPYAGEPVALGTGGLNLYAKWNIYRYSVSFDVQGGSYVAPLTGVEHGSTITAPGDPAKDGMMFGGWYTGADYATEWDFETSAVVSDTVLYAKWIEELYTVTFDSRGGSAVEPLTDIVAGSAIAAPADPVREGFIFAGWYTGADYATAWNFETSAVLSNVTLYAKWIEVLYTVTFDSRGGSAVEPLTDIVAGSAIAAPADPVREGFIFDGWYTSTDYATIWDFETSAVLSNVTLYAKWIEVLYTVAFDSRGGSAVEPLTDVVAGSVIAAPADPVREGFIFDGWYTGADYATEWDFETFTVISDTTLYAKWETLSTGISAPASGSDIQAAGYYSVIGKKLVQAPERGVYIILYSDGSVEKIVRK